MTQALRVLLFAVASILVFFAGYIGAQRVWMVAHHRYDRPESGAFYGSVSGHFMSINDRLYSFNFHGESPVQWFWKSPKFHYPQLQVEWFGEASQGMATVQLPSLAYQCSNSAGVLTHGLLGEWLLGNTNTATSADLDAVDFLHGLLNAAGRGALPLPNHHGHSFETPVLGRIQHFQCGCGVGWPVYVWVGVWVCLVWYTGLRIRKHEKV